MLQHEADADASGAGESSEAGGACGRGARQRVLRDSLDELAEKRKGRGSAEKDSFRFRRAAFEKEIRTVVETFMERDKNSNYLLQYIYL